MYVNGHLHRQYAFVRHSGGKFAIVVANFSQQEETVSLNLPVHFFEFTGLKEKANLTLTDALSAGKVTTPFNSSEPLVVTLPANLGVVLS